MESLTAFENITFKNSLDLEKILLTLDDFKFTSFYLFVLLLFLYLLQTSMTAIVSQIKKFPLLQHSLHRKTNAENEII